MKRHVFGLFYPADRLLGFVNIESISNDLMNQSSVALFLFSSL
jgi:hypothetical protein